MNTNKPRVSRGFLLLLAGIAMISLGLTLYITANHTVKLEPPALKSALVSDGPAINIVQFKLADFGTPDKALVPINRRGNPDPILEGLVVAEIERTFDVRVTDHHPAVTGDPGNRTWVAIRMRYEPRS